MTIALYMDANVPKAITMGFRLGGGDVKRRVFLLAV